jgi:hypothetical protein
MSLQLTENGSRFTSINVTSSYDFRSIVLANWNFDEVNYHHSIPYERNLILKWDTAHSSYFEELYFKTITDDTDVPLETALRQQSPTLISFFATQMIDIPFCLKKVKFSHSSSAANPKLRFVTALMRHGKRQTVSKLYSQAASRILTRHFLEQASTSHETDWRLIFTAFAQTTFASAGSHSSLYTPLRLLPKAELQNRHAGTFTARSQTTLDQDWFNELLADDILSYTPVFSFSIKSVDKLKRRHSRGKSGNHEIVWKYVPRYKRLLVVLRWLTRDIQFQKSKTFRQRIEKSLETLIFNKTDHLAYKLRKFVHRFVFQRYKKTLLRTLRTAY